jgi:hypothetical protein
MTGNSRAAMRPELVRSTIDFVLLLALFWTMFWAISPANATSYALLSLSAASMVTFNLAFLRHLRRVYASPRRGVWRRA